MRLCMCVCVCVCVVVVVIGGVLTAHSFTDVATVGFLLPLHLFRITTAYDVLTLHIHTEA